MEETFVPTCYATRYANKADRTRVAQWLTARGIPWQQVGYIDAEDRVCIKVDRRSSTDIVLPVGGWLIIFMSQIHVMENDSFYNLAKTGMYA